MYLEECVNSTILGWSVTNAVVLWNTIYMQADLEHLQQQSEIIKEEESALRKNEK